MAEAHANSPMGLGDMIERLAEIKAEKRDLNKQISTLDEEYAEVEAAVMQSLDAQGMQFAGSSQHRATITESVVPTVEDWDQFEQYAKDEDAMFLFQRRVATAAWRELHESGVLVPGTEPYTKRALSLTKARR